ncbi:MAG: hypothetical protein QOH97_3511 [Actinoplanes sp.]|jgi:hypothetical protein|nr:hypothetical protein [Actinoplanes sp.]
MVHQDATRAARAITMRVVHLVPPMDDEPPGDFVAFVYARLGGLQREAARLTGGPQHADEVYPEALADVAGHWRRLRLRRRLTGRDAAGAYLARRLDKRATRWRTDQVYEIEVHAYRPPVRHRPDESIALRKAALLERTERRQICPLAEATIAWSHASRRAHLHSVARVATSAALLLLALVRALPAARTGF